MSTIHGVIQFGVRVKLTTPVLPNEAMTKTLLGMAEAALTQSLMAAVGATLKLLPGVTATLTEGKAGLAIEKVET